jgi:hypothetical protein
VSRGGEDELIVAVVDEFLDIVGVGGEEDAGEMGDELGSFAEDSEGAGCCLGVIQVEREKRGRYSAVMGRNALDALGRVSGRRWQRASRLRVLALELAAELLLDARSQAAVILFSTRTLLLVLRARARAK